MHKETKSETPDDEQTRRSSHCSTPDCAQCVFFADHGEDEETGDCRRYPPVYLVNKADAEVRSDYWDANHRDEYDKSSIVARYSTSFGWPVVDKHEYHWCGEFKERP